jgi:hypothetical protein
MTCEQCRNLFTDALYHDLKPEELARFDEHMRACMECSTAYHGIEHALTVMDQRQRPEPDEAYWKNFWVQLQARIGPRPENRLRRLFPASPRIAYSAAALLLIAIGVYLGKLYFAPGQNTQRESLSIAQNWSSADDTLSCRTLAYLERSKNLLIGLVNLDERSGSPPDIRRQQRISRELLEQAHYLKAALNRPDQQQLRQLILDLEIILLELANVEVRPGVPAVELVRNGVEKKSLLLKINLEELRAAAHRPPKQEIARPHL